MAYVDIHADNNQRAMANNNQRAMAHNNQIARNLMLHQQAAPAGSRYYAKNREIYDATTGQSTGRRFSNVSEMAALLGYMNQGGGSGNGYHGSTESTGGMAYGGSGSQQGSDQNAAWEAQMGVARNALKDQYDTNIRGTVNALSSRGMSSNPVMSSIGSEDVGGVNKNYAQSLADLEAKGVGQKFGVQGQDISNQAALQNMAMQQRQQSQSEQNARYDQLYKLMGLS